MASNHINGQNATIEQEEHRSVNGINAKAVVPYFFDGTNLTPGGAGLIPQGYDYISIPSYDANNNPLTVIYMVGGSGGTVVATLTITYDVNGNVSTVART